jgi:hypothetical protein
MIIDYFRYIFINMNMAGYTMLLIQSGVELCGTKFILEPYLVYYWR